MDTNDKPTPEEITLIDRAKEYLKENSHSSMEIVELLGFGHRYPDYLKLFKKVTGGLTPSQYLHEEGIDQSKRTSSKKIPETATVVPTAPIVPSPTLGELDSQQTLRTQALGEKLEDIVQSVPAMDKITLEKTKKFLLEKYGIDYIARELGYSNRDELSSAFRASTGKTASDWYKLILDNRVNYVEGRLRNREHPENFYKEYGYDSVKQLIKSYRIIRKGKTIGDFLTDNNISIKGFDISEYQSKKQVESSKLPDTRFRKGKTQSKSEYYITGSVETAGIKSKLNMMESLLHGAPHSVYLFSKELAKMMGGRVTQDGVGIFIARLLIETDRKTAQEIKVYLPQVVELSAGKEIAKRLYGHNYSR